MVLPVMHRVGDELKPIKDSGGGKEHQIEKWAEGLRKYSK